MQMSRSVIMPTTARSRSMTGSAPRSWSHGSRAAIASALRPPRFFAIAASCQGRAWLEGQGLQLSTPLELTGGLEVRGDGGAHVGQELPDGRRGRGRAEVVVDRPER